LAELVNEVSVKSTSLSESNPSNVSSRQDVVLKVSQLYPGRAYGDALLAATQHADPGIRLGALAVLPTFVDSEALRGAAEIAVNDSDPRVRELAERVLANLK
jgi:hypothetical protein